MTRTRIAKATACLYSGDRTAALSSVVSPISTAPSIAPYGWPAPPSTTAASTTIRYSDPLPTPNEPESIAATVPARPHSAPVMTQTASMIRPVAIPQARASVGLAAVARIALPMRVNVSRAWMAAIAARAMVMIATCADVRTRPPAPTVAPLDIV